LFKKLSTGYKITWPGLLLALVFFFMPWVLQSCGNEPMRQYSGLQLALGSGESEGYKGNIFVVLMFVAIIVIVLLAIRSTRQRILKIGDSYGVSITSVAVLLLLFQQFLKTPDEGVNREILYGLWGFILGWLLILIGGVVNIVERNKSKE
jgi:hypothetical protein